MYKRQPGGQHVNKTASKVTLRFSIENSASLTPEQKIAVMQHPDVQSRVNSAGEIVIHVQSSRSQLQNKETALAKLNTLIGESLRPVKPRKPTKPSSAVERKRVEDKRRKGALKFSRARRGEED